MFQNYQEKVVNHWQKLVVTIVSFIGLFLFAGIQTNIQAEESVNDYSATVNVQADGTMQQEETIGFGVKGTVEKFQHRIALTDMSKLNDLTVNMKSVNSDSYFTFAESDSNEVGTYTISKREDQAVDIDIFNTVTDAPHITQISATIGDAWTNYSEWTILKNQFLALPYDVNQAVLTVTFPQAVPEDQSDLIISGPSKTDLQWADDRKSFTLTVEDLKADEAVDLQMYMPVSILPDNQKVGADSEGAATIEAMQASQEAATKLQRRLAMQIWSVSASLFVLIFTYTIYLYVKKRQTMVAVPSQKGIASQPNAYGPQTVARLMGKAYSDQQKIVLLVLELIEAKVLAAHFEVNKGGQLTDIQVSPLHQQDIHQPAGQLLLTAIQDKASSNRDAVSLNELVFNQSTGKLTMLSRFGRKLIRKINQTAKQPLARDGVYSKMNQVYMAILTLYMVAWLFGTGFVIYWQFQLRAFNVWASILLVVSVALVALLHKNVLPMRSGKGVSLYKQWQSYLKGIYGQVSNPNAWNQQSHEWLDHQYLYAWVAGSNVKLAKAADQQAQLVQLPLMGSAQAIDHLQLSKLKWQPQAEQVSDEDINDEMNE